MKGVRRASLVLLAFMPAVLCGPQSVAASAWPEPGPDPEPVLGPPAETTLEVQVELHRRGFSCGSIDGIAGGQTEAALRAFQRSEGIAETGLADPATRALLRLTAPALGEHDFTAAELAGLRPVPETWLEKSKRQTLGYASAIEVAAERYHALPDFLRQLNPEVDWTAIRPGTAIVVPAASRVMVRGSASQIVIDLGARQLEAIDALGEVIAHFPVSIARMADKRPIGNLLITVVILNPDYTFDPELFSESAEGRSLGRRLLIPPGPNNPVGLAWIGLNRPGYGIHGTPDAQNVGHTESHGCFRLANWDALTLVRLVRVGMPVIVEP